MLSEIMSFLGCEGFTIITESYSVGIITLPLENNLTNGNS